MRSLAAVLLLLAAPASAATIVLDFTSPAPGFYDEIEYPEVRLSEWRGGELAIVDNGSGPFLEVGEQGGSLLLEFLVPVVFVELVFGGDSSDPAVESDAAVLVGLAGGDFAGVSVETPNRNGAIDQALRLSAPPSLGLPPIDRALFTFSQLGENEPLSPLVGRITLETIDVPEPRVATLIALAAGIAAAYASRFRTLDD